MSYVTTVVLMADEDALGDDLLAYLNAYESDTGREHGEWKQADFCSDFGGYMCGEAEVYLMTFNYLNADRFIAYLDAYEWKAPDMAAALLQANSEDFTVWRPATPSQMETP